MALGSSKTVQAQNGRFPIQRASEPLCGARGAFQQATSFKAVN
jgi:hypothetical protein